MTGKVKTAYELNHRGRIHRASSFDELLGWVKEYRVSSKDTFREAGDEEWTPVLSRREFAAILNPDNQWSVSMASGVYRAPDFEILVAWAKEGRITEDAVVEGPRTPPGGVRATALPAMAPHLRKIPGKDQAPWLKIDGRTFRAPDTETVRQWIRESRVPLEAEFSRDGKNWEPVSSCGLFDLEDWPRAAHGAVEEDLPEMPSADEPPELTEEEAASEELDTPAEDASDDAGEVHEESGKAAGVPFTVISAESDITVESSAELRRLLKKRVIRSYDEIRHPSIKTESTSVGEYLDTLRKTGSRKAMWIVGPPLVAAAVVCALELAGVIDYLPWF